MTYSTVNSRYRQMDKVQAKVPDAKNLSVIRGRIDRIERIPFQFQPAKPSVGMFAQMYAPIILALTGNVGMATAVENQNQYINGTWQRYDKAGHAAQQNDSLKVLSDYVYLIKLTISGVTYRTVMSGLCFVVGDEVDAVVDWNGGLLAVARADQTAMIPSGDCQYGFAYLMKNLCGAFKFLFSIMMVLIVISDVIVNASNWHGWTALLTGLLFGTAISALLCAVVCCFVNRQEFIPVLLSSRIFRAL